MATINYITSTFIDQEPQGLEQSLTTAGHKVNLFTGSDPTQHVQFLEDCSEPVHLTICAGNIAGNGDGADLAATIAKANRPVVILSGNVEHERPGVLRWDPRTTVPDLPTKVFAFLVCHGIAVYDQLTLILPQYGIALEEIERQAIIQALKRSNWVQKDAAELLSISPRAINYKIKVLGINVRTRKVDHSQRLYA